MPPVMAGFIPMGWMMLPVVTTVGLAIVPGTPLGIIAPPPTGKAAGPGPGIIVIGAAVPPMPPPGIPPPPYIGTAVGYCTPVAGPVTNI